MSEWFYIRLAYGVTWVVLAGYLLLLIRRSRSAEQALRKVRGGDA
jgi:CcmD family protein